jgi:glycosyltransferase involved in cell wall biosynthesis
MAQARRVLYCNRNCYFDDSNGAAVASRAMMEALGRMGFAVEALTGSMIEAGPQADPNAWRKAQGVEIPIEGGTWTADPRGIRDESPPHDRLVCKGVPVTVHRGSTRLKVEPDESERREFFNLFQSVTNRFRPDVLVNFGGDGLSNEIRARAKARGITVVFALHNLSYHHDGPFASAHSVIVPSRLARDHYRRTLGLKCTVLPNLIDLGRVKAEAADPRYVTFVNPSFEKGVYAFARIAEILGRERPEIPFLVVEARGSERTLADCGLDLTGAGNVFLMEHTSDPRQFWELSKICVMPSLWMENQPLVAIEAMANGIPVIGSDRGGIPEALGESGLVLPLPEWMTPRTRVLPTAGEVARWVEAIVRIWDDGKFFEQLRRKARREALRWSPDVLEPLHAEFFRGEIPKRDD